MEEANDGLDCECGCPLMFLIDDTRDGGLAEGNEDDVAGPQWSIARVGEEICAVSENFGGDDLV